MVDNLPNQISKKGSIWQKFLLVLIVIWLTLYILVWTFSPWLARYVLTPVLAEHQLVLSEDSQIRFNPFLTEFRLTSLRVFAQEETQPVFSLGIGQLKISALALLNRQLLVQEFLLADGSIEVKNTAQGKFIAGVNLDKFPSSARTGGKRSEQTATPNGLNDFSFVAKQLAVRNFTVHVVQQLNDKLKRHQLNFAQLALTDVTVEQGQQRLQLVVDGQFDQSQVALELALQSDLIAATPKIIANGRIDVKSLSLLNYADYYQEQLSGSLSLSSYFDFLFYNERQSLALKQFASDLSQLELGQQQWFLQAEGIHLSSPLIELNPLDVTEKLTAPINLLGENIRLTDRQQSLLYGQVGQFKFDTLNVALSAGQFVFNITDLLLEQIALSDVLTEPQPPLVQVQRLLIKQMELTPKKLAIEHILTVGVHGSLLFDQQRQLQGLVQPTETTISENDKNETVESSSTSKEFNIHIQKVSLGENAKVDLVDQSLSPKLVRQLTLEEFTLGPIDTQMPDIPMQLVINGKSDAYATFALAGELLPFNKQGKQQLTVNISELNLPPFNGHVRPNIGHDILSGHLDMKLALVSEQGQLAGKSDIKLRGIELSSASQQENSIKNAGVIPFNSAINLLKDSNGNVELSVPISGDMDQPDFKLSGFFGLVVKQAVMMAAKDYLIRSFIPYSNVVSVALTAGEYLLAVTFDDLIFLPGQVEYREEQQAYITELSNYLMKKPQQIIVCPVVTPADIKHDGLLAELTEQQTEQLWEIAEQRVDNFKRILVSEKGLPASNVLTCQPLFKETSKAKPSITIKAS